MLRKSAGSALLEDGPEGRMRQEKASKGPCLHALIAELAVAATPIPAAYGGVLYPQDSGSSGGGRSNGTCLPTATSADAQILPLAQQVRGRGERGKKRRGKERTRKEIRGNGQQTMHGSQKGCTAEAWSALLELPIEAAEQIVHTIKAACRCCSMSAASVHGVHVTLFGDVEALRAGSACTSCQPDRCRDAKAALAGAAPAPMVCPRSGLRPKRRKILTGANVPPVSPFSLLGMQKPASKNTRSSHLCSISALNLQTSWGTEAWSFAAKVALGLGCVMGAVHRDPGAHHVEGTV
eukprot:1158504-Pelagomonas_calceolata.AAC.5